MPKTNWTVSDALKQKLMALVLADIATGNMEVRDKGNGQYATTGQQTIAIDDLGDIAPVGEEGLDLKGGYARFSFSLTAYPSDRRAKTTTDSADAEQRVFKLKPSEVTEIESLLAHATETGDVPMAARLMTIKALNGRGLVGRDDLIFIGTAIEAALAAKK